MINKTQTAAMNTYPLTMVSNALSGKHMGTYLGLFNCSICGKQIEQLNNPK